MGQAAAGSTTEIVAKNPPGVNPLAMRLAQAAFGGLGELAPDVMSRLAYRLYFTPRRFRRPAREVAWLERAERLSVSTSSGDVAVYAWSPPGTARGTVLLVHGWEGRGTQLGGFIEPFHARGWRVVAFDAPAHGHSDGERSDLVKFQEAIRAVASLVGPLQGAVAHSMGGASLALALADGLAVQRAVLLCSPCHLEEVLSSFVSMLHLTPETTRRLRRMVEADFGDDVWERFTTANSVRALELPALIVHDEDDPEVALPEAVAIHRAWSGSRLHVTRGLGHRRILKDPSVHHEVTAFLAGEHAA